ncbi:H2 subunit A [Seminavis robusta]|uniref:Ribonuclease n=1 Tax=Seminavis robusta TaxID=568900 RepID=A0A9N8H5E7_9STRA|nr:H2 subunit A [Seminavis robusta]|eukprot:Sro72_g040030.1 H2 subunit A (387) ;mRNA; r:100847-102126
MTISETTSTSTSADTGANTGNDDDNYIAAIYSSKRGVPFDSREESVKAMRALMGQQDSNDTPTVTQSQRPPLSNVHGQGPMFLSDIPKSARRPGVCVGIDEAGRGSVLGPMVYGAAFWNSSLDNNKDDKGKGIIPKGFHDSKQLTDDTRVSLLEQLMACAEIGWCSRILEASEISRNMLRAGLPYNLNHMSHDAAMAMIEAIQNAGVDIQTCYIDTVGNADHYKRKLERKFPNLEFVVESKADAKYATCSAASVVAKVLRDRMSETWQFTEPLAATKTVVSREFGSGYPSDPKCKQWMANNLHDPVFAWPDMVRFSWAPAKKTLLTDVAAMVAFEADEEEDDDALMDMASKKRQQAQMSAFLKKGKKDRRMPFFEERNLETVSDLF